MKLIDRNNYHTFTPLLYQVATASLDPSEIAYPIRAMTSKWPNAEFLMGNMVGVNPIQKQVDIQVEEQVHQLEYNYLILAGGSQTYFFDMQDIAATASGVKDLTEAVLLRNHILTQIERAVWNDDYEYRQASATIVVVGGGPTGIETAGALYELSTQVLIEFSTRDERIEMQVILVEAGDCLLKPYPQKLQEATLRQLESLGVEVVLGDRVVEASPEYVRLDSGRVIKAKTLIWAAGVQASSLGELLGVPLAKGGRVPVRPTTEVVGLEDIYAVGDMAFVQDGHGEDYPMMIQPAKQQGILAASNILRREKGEPQGSFQYNDRGSMATIGMNRAVAWLYNRVTLTGFLAWSAWLSMHLLWMTGFRNRFNALINSIWYYFAQDRSVRTIIKVDELSSKNT